MDSPNSVAPSIKSASVQLFVTEKHKVTGCVPLPPIGRFKTNDLNSLSSSGIPSSPNRNVWTALSGLQCSVGSWVVYGKGLERTGLGVGFGKLSI